MTKTFYKLQYQSPGTQSYRDSVVYSQFETEEDARLAKTQLHYELCYRVVRVTTTEEVLD